MIEQLKYSTGNVIPENIVVELAKKTDRKFDLVYLDGAHAFIHDGVAVCLLKEMIAKDGYLVLDDICWSFKTSPTCNPGVRPETLNGYTDEQIETCQVRLVEECFLDLDCNFEKMSCSTNDVSVYKKVN